MQQNNVVVGVLTGDLLEPDRSEEATELGLSTFQAGDATAVDLPRASIAPEPKPKVFRGTLLTSARDRMKASGPAQPAGGHTKEMQALLGGTLFGDGDLGTKQRTNPRQKRRKKGRGYYLLAVVPMAGLGFASI